MRNVLREIAVFGRRNARLMPAVLMMVAGCSVADIEPIGPESGEGVPYRSPAFREQGYDLYGRPRPFSPGSTRDVQPYPFGPNTPRTDPTFPYDEPLPEDF